MFGIVKGHQTLLQGKKYFKGNIINGTFLLLVMLVIRMLQEVQQLVPQILVLL
jgi:hypothetical protein